MRGPTVTIALCVFEAIITLPFKVIKKSRYGSSELLVYVDGQFKLEVVTLVSDFEVRDVCNVFEDRTGFEKVVVP